MRLLTGVALIYFGISEIRDSPAMAIFALQTVAALAGIVLVVGIFTPLAGGLAAIAEVSVAIMRFSSDGRDPWIALAEAILAAALAMIGPGAWSIDARLFGRKRIDLPDR